MTEHSFEDFTAVIQSLIKVTDKITLIEREKAAAAADRKLYSGGTGCPAPAPGTGTETFPADGRAWMEGFDISPASETGLPGKTADSFTAV